jgi:DNA invertase Pin-like site-specific DNA recombinase
MRDPSRSIAAGQKPRHTETLACFSPFVRGEERASTAYTVISSFWYGSVTPSSCFQQAKADDMFKASSKGSREGGRPLRVAIYTRVSTDRQSVDNQLREIHEVADRMGWQVVEEFSDRGISGAKGRKDRPRLDSLLKGVSRKDFDLVAAWSVDRIGRSLIDLVGFLKELHATGVDLYLHQQGLNTTTPAGQALFGVMGVFAEFERAMIQERIHAGLARARARGTRTGNPIGRPSVGDAKEQAIRELRSEGLGMVKIAKKLGCGVSVVQRVLDR